MSAKTSIIVIVEARFKLADLLSRTSKVKVPSSNTCPHVSPFARLQHSRLPPLSVPVHPHLRRGPRQPSRELLVLQAEKHGTRGTLAKIHWQTSGSRRRALLKHKLFVASRRNILPQSASLSLHQASLRRPGPPQSELQGPESQLPPLTLLRMRNQSQENSVSHAPKEPGFIHGQGPGSSFPNRARALFPTQPSGHGLQMTPTRSLSLFSEHSRLHALVTRCDGAILADIHGTGCIRDDPAAKLKKERHGTWLWL